MKKTSKTEEILAEIDDNLLRLTPGTDSYDRLLEQRQKVLYMRRDERKKVDPNTIMTCSTSLLQVVGVAVVGFLTRLDKDAMRFINNIKP